MRAAGGDRVALARSTPLLLVAIAMVSMACRRTAEPALTDRLLAAATEAASTLDMPAPDVATARREIERVARLTRERVAAGEADAVRALTHVVFEDLGYERVVDNEHPRFSLLPQVVAGRRGNCFGLGQLFIVAGAELGAPIRGVLAPGHFFVRLGKANVELLRHGEIMPTAWYRARFATPSSVDAYLRPLADDEVLAVLQYNIGNELRRRGDLEGALGRFTEAARLFEGFAEAHASRGLVLQLKGDLRAAQASYARARRLHPSLPGLQKNAARLAQEISEANRRSQ